MCELKKETFIVKPTLRDVPNLENCLSEIPVEIPLVHEILVELKRAEKIHPVWPDDPIYAAAIISEEAGEVVKAVNNAVTGKKDGKDSDYRTEAIQCAAMCIRFLKNLDNFNWDTKY